MTDTDRLVDRIEREIGEWARWPGGWPEEADAALVDAIFSARARYVSVVLPLVQRYRRWEGRPPGRDLRALASVSRENLHSCLDNHQVVPGGSGMLKIDAVRASAAMMLAENLNSPSDIRVAAAADPWRVRMVLQRTSGVGVATSAYFLMLMGIEGVKADTMMVGFVERALGRSVGQEEVERLVGLASKRLGCSRTDLDYAIWRHESEARLRLRDARTRRS